MAAWYPDEPSKAERTSMKRFFSALGRFYPCPWCATDFRANLEEKPPQYVVRQVPLLVFALVPQLSTSLFPVNPFSGRTSSRKELCQWLCDQHNIVNHKLGKTAFPCDMTSLDERWRKSNKAECQKR
jgi:FAD-linked sulfhydryl oxidase